MIILIDMDEVLADFESRLLEIWSQQYPHTILFPNGVRKSFYIGADEDGTKSELVNKIIHSEGFFSSLKPLPGSREALAEMQALGHSTFIVTSPGISYPNAASEKYEWVNRYFGSYMLERLIITPAKPVIRGDILIDDRPEISYEDSALWEHVLFDKSYNKEVMNKRRITWEDWKEVLTELL
jgi:5'-nucleotidase